MNPHARDPLPEELDSQPAGEAAARPPRELGGRLAGLSLPRQVMVLAIWPLMEQVLNLLVGVVDLALAGHLKPAEYAVRAADALGVASYVSWLMALFTSAVGVGSTALIARALGARRRAAANAVLGQSMMMGLFVGACMGALVFAIAGIVGRLAGLGDETLPLYNAYLRLLCLAAPANGVLFVGNACLRGAGDMRTPFITMVVVNIVNTALSMALVWGPAPIGGHGVHGIAIGTVVAWYVGAIMVVVTLARDGKVIRLYRKRLRPHLHTLRRIIRIGLPNLMETVGGMWLANFVVISAVGRLKGEGLIGAHMIAIRVESFSYQPGFALGMAAATLMGQYLGLGDPQRAGRAARLCWITAAIIMGVTGVFFVVQPLLLARIMTDNPLLLEQAQWPIRICGFVQAFFATGIVLSNALRGAGDTAAVMKLTYLSVFALRLPGVLLLGHVLGYGLPGIWIALCFELTCRGALYTARFLHGGWARIRI